MTLEAREENKAGFAGVEADRAAASRRHAKEYLRKHQLAPAQIAAAPSPQLRLVVVIPCREEIDLPLTLGDLSGCEHPGCGVEVIVVLNASEKDPERVRVQNRRSHSAIEALSADADLIRHIRFHALSFERLPAKHAGVGLARKLGMDEAVRRLLDAGADDGIIVCLDADCRVERNYLSSIVAHFDRHADTPACSIHFEHPLTGALSAQHYRAVMEYELFIRYYRWGLRFCGHPCAHYTVGSCMAVRASTYVRQGGMNRRKGAEDFYFLNKLMLLGGFTELGVTTVKPSPRESWRVPFGTGRAVIDALANPAVSLQVYAPQVFDELGALSLNVDELRENEMAVTAALPEALRGYLEMQNFHQKLAEIRTHTSTAEAFRSRFFRWLDGFRALKFVRHATDQCYPRVPVEEAALALLQRMKLASEGDAQITDPLVLLTHYRRMDAEQRMIRLSGKTSEMEAKASAARL
ncbi:MAG: glycosyltransferase [Gammaproteobacteria bacterium]|nr:glycosyltransferase [Gammaproteobacteria bacterium]